MDMTSTMRTILFAISIFPTCALAEFSVDPIFSDGMVLQRDLDVTIRGNGVAGASLELRFQGQRNKATVDRNGRWSVTLDPLSAASQPSMMTITVGRTSLVLRDIVVGDVWLCSGQSNMGFKLAKCISGENAAQNANDTLLRVNNFRDTWKPCVRETAAETSGVSFFFARKLRQQNPDVPIGIIVRALSGTPIEYWTPAESLKSIEFCRQAINRFTTESDEGRKILDFLAAEDEWKKARRKAGKDRKVAGRKPRYEGDQETLVLGEIYGAGNPGRLWRERIKPEVGFGLKGVIWYQGERNTKAGNACASHYHQMLAVMIRSWRKAWNQGDFRFLVVQLPPFDRGGPNWSVVQKGQSSGVSEVPNADYIDTSDLPDDGLHPKDKRPIGERLAEKQSE